MTAEHITIADFRQLILSGILLPGDAVLYAPAKPTAVQKLIARVQRRALEDLASGRDIPVADQEQTEPVTGLQDTPPDEHPETFVHAGMIEDHRATVEMTSPRARRVDWCQVLTPGMRIAVVRPAAAAPQRLLAAALRMGAIASQGDPYPTRELLSYWFLSWQIRKLWRRQKFINVFADRNHDVCSGTIWTAWQATSAVLPAAHDQMPEAWYPARFYVDTDYLCRVGEYIIRPGDATVTDPCECFGPFSDAQLRTLPA